MLVEELPLAGLRLLTPRIERDHRGFLVETYHAPRYAAAGIGVRFVQTNHSRSVGGTVRGLHYQAEPGQAKLIRVLAGRIWDVVVDLRPESPTFGRWHAIVLDGESHRQLFIPVGFAHGFAVESEVADVEYLSSAVYDPATERGLAWDDPELGVTWPVAAPLLSQRDRTNESFAAFAARVRG